MAALKTSVLSPYGSRRRAENREYRLIFCLLYPQLLVAAIVMRIASLAAPRRPASGEARRSVFAEARSAAASCIPFAFK